MALDLYILNDERNPILEPDVIKWGRWFENISNRILVKTQIGDVQVSTVFLGIDHNFSEDGPPLLYETMIFYPPGAALGDVQDRYATRAEAIAGHRVRVTEVKSRSTA